MVSMEEIIQLQKREEATQKAAAEKERRAALKVAAATDQVPPAKPGQLATKKNKEKGITISEGGSPATRSVPTDNAPQSKKDGKKRVGEQAEALPAIRQRTSPSGTVAMFPVSVTKVTGEKLVVHSHLLFGEMIPSRRMLPFQAKGPLHSLTIHCMP